MASIHLLSLRSSRLLSAVAVAVLSSTLGGLGCSDLAPLYGDVISPPGQQQDNVPSPDLAMRPEYPPGPYGNQTGDVIHRLTLPGYRLSPTEMDRDKLGWDEAIDINDFHANPACKCLLVTFTASWCGACQQEQPVLIREVGNDPSFCVLNIHQEGFNNQKDATREDVDGWIEKFGHNYYVVQGSSKTKQLWQGYGATISLPFNMVVKPDTMQVMGTVQGFAADIKKRAEGFCAGE